MPARIPLVGIFFEEKKMGKKKKSKIFVQSLLSMLKEVNLNGIIKECFLSVEKGQGYINAVDATGNLIVLLRSKIMTKNSSMELGLGNIELLIKFLSTLNDEKSLFKHAERRLNIRRLDGRRKLSYHLTEADVIASRIQFDDEDEEATAYEDMMETVSIRVELTQSFIKDYISYFSMMPNEDVDVAFKFDGEETLSIIIGEQGDHKFDLELSNPVEELDSDDSEEFEVKINGAHLSKIFGILNFDEEDPPTINITGETRSVIVHNGDDDEVSAWALVALADIETVEEEDDE